MNVKVMAKFTIGNKEIIIQDEMLQSIDMCFDYLRDTDSITGIMEDIDPETLEGMVIGFSLGHDISRDDAETILSICGDLLASKQLGDKS